VVRSWPSISDVTVTMRTCLPQKVKYFGTYGGMTSAESGMDIVPKGVYPGCMGRTKER
jgi:hypothetical protein